MKSQNYSFEPIVVPGVAFLSTAKIANPKGCFIENEDKKRPVLVIQGKVDETRVQIPREEQFLSPLGICDHLLILQLRLPSLNHFALELIITHLGNSRMKLILGTHLKETRCDKPVGRMPVAMLPLIIPRNQWVQVVFHIKGIVDKIFNLSPFNFIDSVSFCGNARIGMMMSSSSEELCLEKSQTKMAVLLVPAYGPPVWSTAVPTPKDDVPKGVSHLSDLQYDKSDKKDMLKDINFNPNCRASTDSIGSMSRVLSPLPESSSTLLASSGNPNMASTTSNSSSSSGSKRLPAITMLDTSKKTRKYFRLIHTDDSSSSIHNKQNYPTFVKRSPQAIFLAKEAVDLGTGKTAILGGKQSIEASFENPVTSWVSDIHSCDKDTAGGLCRSTGKKDSYMPKTLVARERNVCNSGSSPQQSNILVRKGRPLRSNDRGGDIEISLSNAKKKQRDKLRMRLLRQNKAKMPKDLPEPKLASEVSIYSIYSSSESPQVDGAACSFFGGPKVGYGVGYLGVLNDEGEYIDDQGVNIRLNKTLALGPFDDDE
ncbi:unnamed protein product [Phytomonas sp. EM1]|nr:unnamed protein product [Phytomonas sp. EM1]|eukprot:CCW65476.1 unnamed protein product [Phytomonas sp. isolate EM1]